LFVSCAKKEEGLLIANFELLEKINALGGGFGAWNKDPSDSTQFCEESIVKGRDGYVLKLVYDVDSPNPAYNGFWMKLNGADFSKYKKISLLIKGDETAGFTDTIKVELKNKKGEVGRSYIRGITSNWKEYEIPFESFRGIKDFSEMDEFVIVFADTFCKPKVGVIYVDDIKVK